MGDNRLSAGLSSARETYGIDTGRILDACRDRDCFEDVRVFLTCAGDEAIIRTGNIRVKCARITGCNISLDPIQFNSGFYSVMIKFYVFCTFEVCLPCGQSQELTGIAVLEKRVVLFGGESNVNVFRSNGSGSYCAIPEPITSFRYTPEVVVEVLEPVVLGVKLVESRHECHCCCCCQDIPESVSDMLGGALNDDDDQEGFPRRYLAISLGLFSVIRLVREGQLLINATEYAIPDKECISPSEEDPCGNFRKIPFPVAEFSPIRNISPQAETRGGRCCGNS